MRNVAIPLQFALAPFAPPVFRPNMHPQHPENRNSECLDALADELELGNADSISNAIGDMGEATIAKIVEARFQGDTLEVGRIVNDWIDAYCERQLIKAANCSK